MIRTVTLVSAEPELQWVALRNINLILQQRPDALSNELRVFFCKYNDPPYVKIEKLDIMIRIAAEKNIDTLLSELKECARLFSCRCSAHVRCTGTPPRSTSTLYGKQYER